LRIFFPIDFLIAHANQLPMWAFGFGCCPFHVVV
jgi:hypothetical protein